MSIVYTCKDCSCMTNSKTLFGELVALVTVQTTDAETESIIYRLLEKVLAISRADIAAEKSVLLDDERRQQLHRMIRRVNAEEPVQYILGERERSEEHTSELQSRENLVCR